MQIYERKIEQKLGENIVDIYGRKYSNFSEYYNENYAQFNLISVQKTTREFGVYSDPVDVYTFWIQTND